MVLIKPSRTPCTFFFQTTCFIGLFKIVCYLQCKIAADFIAAFFFILTKYLSVQRRLDPAIKSLRVFLLSIFRKTWRLHVYASFRATVHLT